MKNFIQKGFTLAEVLITLAILGVVAAVTLPNMVQDQKYQQLGVQLAKFTSTLENAATAYAVGLGGSFGDNSDVLDFAQNTFILKSGSVTTVSSSSYGCNGSNACELKDGTSISFKGATQADGIYNADVNVVGTGAFIVLFKPDTKLANSLPGVKQFAFVVTTKGYVFPLNKENNVISTCTKALYDAQYRVKPSDYTTGSCKSAS